MKITLSKIRALCRDNSVDLSPFLWHVAKLEKPLAGGIEPGEIDSLPLEEKYCFSLVVGNLPPAVIKEEFGDDVLATAWAFSSVFKSIPVSLLIPKASCSLLPNGSSSGG